MTEIGFFLHNEMCPGQLWGS